MTAAVDTHTVPTQRTPDDAWALVERAQAGDTAAFELIYRQYRDTVQRFIYVRTGDRAVAEDLTADVFVRALKRIGTVQWMGREFGAWLITVAKNIVFDWHKSGYRRLEIATSELMAQGSGPDGERRGRTRLAPHDAADVEVLAGLAAAEVRAALDLLQPSYRRVLLLHYWAGLTLNQIAAAEGSNESAIKALMFRARRSMRRLAPHLEAHR